MQLRSSWIRTISAVLPLICFAGCDSGTTSVVAAPELERLTATELESMLPGNTLATPPSEETAWAVFYEANGIEWGDYGGDTDTGKWRIGGGMLCSDWDTWGDGERCFTLYRTGAGEVLGYSEDVHEWTALLEPGDKRGLKTPR